MFPHRTLINATEQWSLSKVLDLPGWLQILYFPYDPGILGKKFPGFQTKMNIQVHTKTSHNFSNEPGKTGHGM